MDSLRKQLAEATAFVRREVSGAPTLGIVLGSGLGGFVRAIADPKTIPYSEIPHMPSARVEGHPGNLVMGRVEELFVACLQGRVHLYEGLSPERVVFPARLLAELGCHTVLLTNAAGGIARSLSPGDLMLIDDHINLTGQNPLATRDVDHAERFVDMSTAYCPNLRQEAQAAARERDLDLKSGVYAGVLGPSYETPAEIRMLERLGAAAVGMSTVHEVIALRQRGVRVGAVSCITNLAAGISPRPLNHAEVKQVANAVETQFTGFLRAWLCRAGAC